MADDAECRAAYWKVVQPRWYDPNTIIMVHEWVRRKYSLFLLTVTSVFVVDWLIALMLVGGESKDQQIINVSY